MDNKNLRIFLYILTILSLTIPLAVANAGLPASYEIRHGLNITKEESAPPFTEGMDMQGGGNALLMDGKIQMVAKAWTSEEWRKKLQTKGPPKITGGNYQSDTNHPSGGQTGTTDEAKKDSADRAGDALTNSANNLPKAPDIVQEEEPNKIKGVKILTPLPGHRFEKNDITIAGRGSPQSTITLKEPESGKILKTGVDGRGNFLFEKVRLVEGENILMVNQLKPDGEIAFAKTPVSLISPDALITIEKPQEAEVLTVRSIDVSGKAQGAIQITLRQPLDGKNLESDMDEEGNFTFHNVNLKEGDNDLVIKYAGKRGDVWEIVRNITVDTKVSLDIIYPEHNSELATPSILLIGKTDPKSQVTLTLSTEEEETVVTAEETGRFCFENIRLFPGDNLLRLKSIDTAGNQTEKEHLIKLTEKSIGKGLISLDLKEADLQPIIRAIGKQCGLNVVMDSRVSGKVTINLKNVTPREALASILKLHGYEYFIEDKVLRVIRSRENDLLSRLFVLKNIQIDGVGEDEEQLRKQLHSLISEHGRVEINYRTNSILITDYSINMQAVDNFINQMEYLYGNTNKRLMTRVFHLKHIPLKDRFSNMNAGNFLIQLQSFISNEGTFLINNESNTLIIMDSVKNLEKIENLIQSMERSFEIEDEGIETRIFKLKYINLMEESESEVSRGNALIGGTSSNPTSQSSGSSVSNTGVTATSGSGAGAATSVGGAGAASSEGGVAP
ncbi:secretin and TonB N-terminal domain-containing protein [bacterium]|nr:secretin and TonB N-terminal domain-containing protein [bacterium]